MRKLAWFCGAAVVFLLVALVFHRSPITHRITLLTYFQNGAGLKSGAAVRVDGVDLGSVKSVRVRPELGDHPIEVVMAIHSPYELPIPSDSTVTLGTAGVLGPTLVDIDTRNAHGLPVASGGVVKSVEIQSMEGAKSQAAQAP
jgi:phospholipid/cholesterol/gamma-HCH transport system substrate-binding protein